MEALQKLPPDQRRAIELHHLEDQSLAEAAQQMQRSKDAVIGLLFRGLRKLRQLLAEEEEPYRLSRSAFAGSGSPFDLQASGFAAIREISVPGSAGAPRNLTISATIHGGRGKAGCCESNRRLRLSAWRGYLGFAVTPLLRASASRRKARPSLSIAHHTAFISSRTRFK